MPVTDTDTHTHTHTHKQIHTVRLSGGGGGGTIYYTSKDCCDIVSRTCMAQCQSEFERATVHFVVYGFSFVKKINIFFCGEK